MLVELEARLTDANSVVNLRRALALGPWCWPAEDDPAFEHARWASGCEQPPDARGSVLAVTVGERGGCLWALREQPDRPPAPVLGAQAAARWEDAICALPRSLPVLWGSIRRHRDRPSPWHLGSHARRGHGIATPEPIVDGPSIGLAFFLLLASRVLDVRVPPDVVATASLDAFGAVGPVDGLETKIDTLLAVAPRVRRLVVAVAQVEEARSLAGGRLEVLGARNASEAAELLLSDLAARLVQVEGEERRQVVRSFFRLVLSGRRELVDWRPVMTAARLAVGQWGDLSDEERYTLELAEAVAARHEGVPVPAPLRMPPEAWLAALPTPLRVNVVAHLVQHSADTGDLPAKETLALARRDLPSDVKHAFAPQLRLMGAVARLEAFCGSAPRALERQRLLAKAHLANLDYEDVSMPLCEWLRLAGALSDRAALAEAERFFEEAQAIGVFGAVDLGYLQLARSRAEVQCGAPTTRVLGELRRLAEDPAVADHVRRSAARWAVACARALGDAGRLAEAHALFRAACPATGAGADADADAALVALDAALEQGDATAAAAALDTLRSCRRGLMQHLTHDREPQELAAHVARFFPY